MTSSVGEVVHRPEGSERPLRRARSRVFDAEKRSRPGRRIGLRGRLLAMVLIAMAPALSLFFLVGIRQINGERTSAEREMLRLASLAAVQQERLERKAEQLLMLLVEVPAVRGGESGDCGAFLVGVLRQLPSYAELVRVDLDGRVSCSARPQDEAFGARSLIRRAIDEQALVKGEYATGAEPGSHVIPFAQPIVDEEGQVVHVVGVSVDLAWLEAFAAASSLPRGAAISVIDHRRTVVARYPDSDRFIGRSLPETEVARAMSGRREGAVQARGVDGVTRLYGFTAFGVPDGDALKIAVGIPTDVALAGAEWSKRLLFLGALAMVVFSTVAAWAGGWALVVRPVRRLRRVVGRVSRGDLGARVADPGTPGELGDLAVAFDDMAASLERQKHEITVLNETLAHKTQTLAESNEDLEAFAYSVSHDLRAPLRAINGFGQLLAEDCRDQLPEEGKRHLQTVLDSASKMGRLIDALLSFSRAGRQALQRKELHPADVARDVIRELTTEINDHGTRVDVQGGMPPCVADPTLLRQVYMNLIGNAIKFTGSREEPRVEIGAAFDDAGECVYFVRDNGAGFDPRYGHKLFGVFQRLHRTDEFDGTGAGLAIAQRIVQRHGGRIWAEAEVDRGATFSFTIGRES